MKKILLELPDDLAAQVDSRRGNQPRVAWIRDAITARLDVPCETIHKGDAAIREDADETGRTVPATTADQVTGSPHICAHPNWNHWSTRCPDCQERMR